MLTLHARAKKVLRLGRKLRRRLPAGRDTAWLVVGGLIVFGGFHAAATFDKEPVAGALPLKPAE